MSASTPQTSADPDFSIPGLRIQVYDPPQPWALVVRSAEQREEWVARTWDEAEHKVLTAKPVETTIVYRGRSYRILEVTQTPKGWLYRMEFWPENETQFRIVELSPKAWAKREAEQRQFERMVRLSRISPFYEFLVGWLPSRIQEDLSERWEFSPEGASAKNAYIQYMGCMCACIISILLIFAGGPFTPVAIFFYFAAEGFVRHGHVTMAESPCGFPLLELADWLYVRLARGGGVK
jgi:hypothetical protein